MIAADVICGGNERHRLEPMITAACEELARAGIGETPQIALADAGYWNSPHIEQLAGRGIRSLVRPDADSRRTPTRIRSGPLYEQMRELLESDEGKQLPTTPSDHRTRLRPHADHPKRRPIPTPRITRVQGRMATAHRHPRPPQALAPQHEPPAGLNRPRRLPARPPGSHQPATSAQQPSQPNLYATASMQSGSGAQTPARCPAGPRFVVSVASSSRGCYGNSDALIDGSAEELAPEAVRPV